MKPVIFTLALFLSSVMLSCAGPGSMPPSANAEAASPAVPGTMDGLEFLVGDWAIRHYSVQGLNETADARVRYRPIFGGAVLEETRWYDWGIRGDGYIPWQVRWYQRRPETGGWLCAVASVEPRLSYEQASKRDGSIVLEQLIMPNAVMGLPRPNQDRMLVSRATEDGPFERYEPGEDTPLIWWGQTRAHPRLDWSEFDPIAYLERAEAPLREEEISDDMTVLSAWNGFDFWVGEWDLAWEGGSGTNTITREPGPWIVRESFEDSSSGFLGGSLSIWDYEFGRWRQVWMDNRGGFLIFDGGWDGEQMVLTLSYPISSREIIKRMRWHDITDDSLVWTYEGSEDHGATWTTLWEINYTRRQ